MTPALKGALRSAVVRAAAKEQKMNDFADRLADHGNVSQAAREVDITRRTATMYLAEMRERLGPQAE